MPNGLVQAVEIRAAFSYKERRLYSTNATIVCPKQGNKSVQSEVNVVVSIPATLIR